jgi:FKBP-type peptidyl-prolyl cis-trans isomerase FkpA
MLPPRSRPLRHVPSGRRRPFGLHLLVAAALSSAASLLPACSKSVAEPDESHFKPAPPPPVDPGPATLQVIDEAVGKGKAAQSGDKVRVHYTGTLMNGKKFDSSRDHGTPFDFTLGKSEVIKGWDEGVVGMKVGGKRRLVIPEALGYGEAGSPPNIPSRAGLKFEIELLAINPPGAPSASPPREPDPETEIDPNAEDPDEPR